MYCVSGLQLLLCTILYSERLSCVLNRLNSFLILMGIPGLLAISFLDSAAMPLAGGPDAVILLLAWRNPHLAYVMGLAAAIGSTFGSLVLYGIGNKGGEKALSRFKPERIASIEAKMQKHCFWVILGSVLAPPPFPTKLVILAAGVLRTGYFKFTSAVFAGRLIRYSLVAYLAAHFGNSAAHILKSQYSTITLVVLGCILLIVLIRVLKNRKPARV
jgi:membrane protein YqaA with SNARE-associated domain